MSAATPTCQLLERQNADYRGWLWVAPPRDPWLEAGGGQLWSADLSICEAWRERGMNVHCSLQPEIGEVPGVVLFWPKAHALGEWWLLALCAQLPEGTRLQVVGENQGGIKHVLKVLAALGLGCRKLDSARRCTLFETRLGRVGIDPDAAWSTFEALDLPLASHPGVFGHGKLDDGTRLLLESLPKSLGSVGQRILDVGCGDGVIAAWLARRGADVTAVDINAFAVEATRRTFALNGLALNGLALNGLALNGLALNGQAGAVYHSDVYTALPEGERFDAIVSNPPFHQERAVDTGPAARLIAEAPERLTKGGSLILVANAFLPYPDRLDAAFGGFEILADNRRFRVYRAVKR